MLDAGLLKFVVRQHPHNGATDYLLVAATRGQHIIAFELLPARISRIAHVAFLLCLVSGDGYLGRVHDLDRDWGRNVLGEVGRVLVEQRFCRRARYASERLSLCIDSDHKKVIDCRLEVRVSGFQGSTITYSLSPTNSITAMGDASPLREETLVMRR